MMRFKWILFTVLSALISLTAGLTFAGGPPINPPGLERAMAVQEAHTKGLLAVKGVVGTAVGLDAGQPVVKVYVESAGIAGLPETLDGIPVQVEVTGKLFALHHQPGHSGGPPGSGSVSEVDPKSRFDRPVPIGVSSGTELLIEVNGQLFCTVGTLGARVVDLDPIDGPIYYTLSNAHVYAQEGSTTWSANGTGPQSASAVDAILQPGRVDAGGGCVLIEDDQTGALADWEPINFQGNNVIDAAIATIDMVDLDGDLDSELVVSSATPTDGYGVPSTSPVSATLNEPVQKYGRTTSLTPGTVSGINATLTITYDNGVATFVDQIIITPGSFIASGDSGSLAVTVDGNHPVALLFAGGSTIAIGNPIGAVLARFGVAIDDRNNPPTVSIASPGEGTTISGDSVAVTATASDVDGNVNQVEFFVDGAPIPGEITQSGVEWSVSWDIKSVEDGNYNLSAVATDNDDDTTSAPISITVSNDGGMCIDLGASCVDDGDCCSNKCKGKSGSKTCK
jgi:hypothetical protein